jgi:hypothetical protein
MVTGLAAVVVALDIPVTGAASLLFESMGNEMLFVVACCCSCWWFDAPFTAPELIRDEDEEVFCASSISF